MNSAIKELFDFIAKIQENRYKVLRGYKIDRWIIKAFLVLTCGFLLFVAWHYNFQLDYFKCGDSRDHSDQMIFDSGQENCPNPFYKETTWKNQKELPPGEYGFKPTAIFKSVYYMPFILMILAFFINHFVFNRKFDFKALKKEMEVEDEKETDL